jgi:hypothetical protein
VVSSLGRPAETGLHKNEDRFRWQTGKEYRLYIHASGYVVPGAQMQMYTDTLRQQLLFNLQHPHP